MDQSVDLDIYQPFDLNTDELKLVDTDAQIFTNFQSSVPPRVLS